MRNDNQFLVVAIPSDVSSDLSTFQSEMEKKIQSRDFFRQVEVETHEVTQLFDEDSLGDCFVVAMSFCPGREKSVNDDDDCDFKCDPYVIIENLLGDPRAEIWVTGVKAIPLAPPYGWNRETFIWDTTATTYSVCDCLRAYGLTICGESKKQGLKTNNQQQREYVGSDFFSQVTAKLHAHISLLEQTVQQHHPHIRLGESTFGFQEYTHRGPERFEVLFEPNSVLYQELQNGLESKWIDIVCHYLQSDRSRLRLNISCVYSRPGAIDQEWHTDGDHYSHTQTVGDHHNHQPYAVCIFVPLISLTTETGFTRFWPKSHLYPNLLGLARAADALQATIDGVDLQPGDFVMYDYTTWHKGIGNTSNIERPIVQFLYSCDWYKEKKNYGTKSVFDY